MKALTTIALILLSVVAVTAQKVKVGSDPATDFSKYKTYAWDQGAAGLNPYVNQMIIEAVDNAMAAKGIKKVASEPDLVVAAVVSTDSDLVMSNPSWAPSLNSISTGIAAAPQSWPVTKGTLVVDISDAKTKNGVWRGTATHTLEHGPTGDKAHDAKSVAKPINKAVEKMFKQFPPKK
ncbi:MAG: hypothetical protein C5B55_10900 [Blastocatellia bacterium]|nr:MAG: hypothetical protein C5B55_10900 [Blastocatellia bacterium]